MLKYFLKRLGLLIPIVVGVSVVVVVTMRLLPGDVASAMLGSSASASPQRLAESGCAKSTLGRLLLRLIEPTSGSVTFEGTDLTSLGPEQLRRLRSGMQMVFQDPYASLDRRKWVLDILEEGMLAHGQRDHTANRASVVESLGIPVHQEPDQR